MAKTIKVLTEKQCNELLTWLNRNQADYAFRRIEHRNLTMILLMLDAGLRVGEVVKLRRNCLMFANLFSESVVVTADIAKTKVERTIPMTNRLKAAIKKMSELYWIPSDCKMDEFAFYTKEPFQRLSTRQIQRMVKSSAADALGIAVWPHCLRHTFATRLLNRVDTRIIQELMGHKSIQSTQIYTHPNSEHLNGAIDILNGSPC